MRVLLAIIVLGLIVATAFAEDSSESEETATPKKVLRKYRVRRPVSSGSSESVEVVKSSPRIRRVRVKQAKPVVIEATPQTLLSARYANAPVPEKTQPVKQVPTPTPETQAQTQQVFYDEQHVVDPLRVVPNYRQATSSGTRSALLANVNLRDRDSDENKKPAVGTTQNYSHVNEDGSFTFGYVAEDGSFKEETRGVDCVVRGKYGYVDPGGIRREFAYVSGNPCDPNDPNKEQDDEDVDEESIPNPARAGIRQRIPVERRPLINQNVQQALEQTVEERVPEDQVFRPVLRRVRPQTQLQSQAQEPDQFQPTTFRPRIRITQAQPTAAAPVPEAVIRAFPQFRPHVPTLSPRPLPVEPSQDLSDRGGRAFNFQQELQDIAAIQFRQPEAAAPQLQYRQVAAQPQQVDYRQPEQQQAEYRQTQPAQQLSHNSIHGFPQRQHFGSQATSIFQQQRQSQQVQQQASQEGQERPNYARYRTELVYDPSSGQYTNVVVQETPKTGEEFTLTQRLRAFADPQRPDQLQYQPYQQPFQYFGQQHGFNNLGQQFHYQQQPIQYSSQSPQAAATSSITQLHADAQQSLTSSAASGQIDAFLQSLG